MHSLIKRIGCTLVFCLATSVALADVVVVVSAQNSVATLTHNQLADLYLGRVSRFPNGQPATPLDQPEHSSAYTTFYRKYLNQTPAKIKMHWAGLVFTGRGQPPRSVADSKAMADYVSAHKSAIGYLGEAHLDKRFRVVTIE